MHSARMMAVAALLLTFVSAASAAVRTKEIEYKQKEAV